jgi:hypothetical protein
MLCTVLAKVWNVNKKLSDSGRTGAFVRRQAACLSSYCLQRYLISEQKGMTNSRTVSVERISSNDFVLAVVIARVEGTWWSRESHHVVF